MTVSPTARLAALLYRLQGEHVAAERLASDTPLGVGSGASAYQGLHADVQLVESDFGADGRLLEEQSLGEKGLGVNWPLCDVDERNGLFEIQPGSHRVPIIQAHQDLLDGTRPLLRLLMRRGDVLVR